MFKRLTIAILLTFSLLALAIKPLDRSPLEESLYYQNTIKAFDSIKNNTPRHINGDTIKVGWAKKSLIPKYKTPMAGYGARKGAHFEGIEDSIWVSAVIFDNGIYRSAYISMDLLIIPPTLNKEKLVEGLDLESKNIYFTASHTHSSIGGYLERLAGNLFGGTFDAKILEFIRNQTRNAIIEATKNLHNARIGYASIYAADYITNRLVGDSLGTYDPYLRMIKIEKDNGENGIIFSYSAHATCYGRKQLNLSSDYPGKVVEKLEKNEKIDFIVYGAGAVGSMSPRSRHTIGSKKVMEISDGISEELLNAFRSVGTKYEFKLHSNTINIQLREESYKLNSYFIFRPWLFKWLVGNTKKYISYLRIGENLLVGTPCDFSGELVSPIENSLLPIENPLSNKKLNLMINSFNGCYIGYVTDDKWYDRNDIYTYETHTMNWFGPYNGRYISELIKKTIEINENN